MASCDNKLAGTPVAPADSARTTMLADSLFELKFPPMRIPILILSFLIISPRIACAQQIPTGKELNTRAKVDGHWGEEAVGFRWLEEDSVDGRWNQSETGPFLSSSLRTPTGMINKALSIKLGDNASVCYDLQKLSLVCGWTGGFLQYAPARYGIIQPPIIQGKVAFHSFHNQGWMGKTKKYLGCYLHGSRVVLSYMIDGVRVLDSSSHQSIKGKELFLRILQLEPSKERMRTVVGSAKMKLAVIGDSDYAEIRESADRLELTIEPHASTVTLGLLIAGDSSLDLHQIQFTSAKPVNLKQFTVPGRGRWGKPLVTQGRRGPDNRAMTVDTISIPFDNPFKALMFIGGHDFLAKPGRAAVCTLHGDVWLVDGIDADLDRISWRRFATGLFQPLGMKIVDDQIYVLGRDQITRLHDRNGDGEADYYESFNNQANTSAGGHDYSACLETDSQGNFYYVSHRGVHRISRDGSTYETIAEGLRNPNGLSVGIADTITAAPQEGEWTPASAVFEVTQGGYFGYGGPRVGARESQGFESPLFWIPRTVDNSTGGQAWITSDTWNPLADSLLTFSFGQCRILLNPLEPRKYTLPKSWPVMDDEYDVDLTGNTVPEARNYAQGGSLVLPMTFASGVMRGRFSPHDGHLYVSGLRGWVSSAVQDGCFQRVRYTGKPLYLPNKIRTFENGIAISFTEPLDQEVAEDPGSYFAEQWTYAYGAHYGSSELRVSDSKQTGRDEVVVRSATLLDEKTVFLEFPNLKPVKQFAVQYSLRSNSGKDIQDAIYLTINVVPETKIDPRRLKRRPQSNKQSDVVANPGLRWKFLSSRGNADYRVSRLAALYVAKNQSPTPFLRAGPFSAVAEGYLKVPLRGSYTFQAEGTGEIRIRINDREVLAGQGPFTSILRRTTNLNQGLNRFAIYYRSDSNDDAKIRVLWSSHSFAPEPIPPTVLFYDPRDDAFQFALKLRQGRGHFASKRCVHCHGLGINTESDGVMPELEFDAPNLNRIGLRLQRTWVAQWLYQPDAIRSDFEMPHMLSDRQDAKQDAVDIAGFLCSQDDQQSNTKNHGEDDVRKGALLFEDLNCISCHRLSMPKEKDVFQRTSLASVGWKFRSGQLEEFLLRPHEHYRFGRMPNFNLSIEEAAQLAAFLTSSVKMAVPSWVHDQEANANRGQELYQRLRCDACHRSFAKLARPGGVLLRSNRLENGCMDSLSSRPIPKFQLATQERNELLTFLRSNRRSLAKIDFAESTDRALKRLNCQACHDRDDKHADRIEIVAEEGRGWTPEFLPNLTWTGEKLSSDWMARFLRGKSNGKLRPWLKGRMPTFPAHAKIIAQGLANQHGIGTSQHGRSKPDPEVLKIATALVSQKGLDCLQCHGIGKIEPRGDNRTKIALGINFQLVRDRLLPDYYQRFLLDPSRVDPRTKMPKLAPDGRSTNINQIFDGDAKKQFSAIWHFIEHFDTQVPSENPK